MAINDKIKAVKNFFTKAGKRNLIIVCAVALIGAAVWMNWMFFKDADDGFTHSGSVGMSGELDNSKNPTSGGEGDASANANTDSYFSTVQVSRQRARDEALEVLNAVIDNANASDEVKAEAVAEVNKIADEMKQEANIESMVISAGFEKCVAVISEGTASVVVKCENGQLTPAQLAQINTAVYEFSGIEPINVTVIGRP